MIALYTEEMRRNPFPVYAQLRALAPVLQLPGSEVWMVLGHEGVKRVLHDHEAFTSEVSPPDSIPSRWLVFFDPPRHTKLRALILKAFTPRAIAALEPRIREISRALLEPHLDGDGELDLVDDFAVPLPMMVIGEMLGTPVGDLPRLRAWSEVILSLAQTISGTAEAAQQAEAAFRAVTVEMREYLASALAERRGQPRDDLFTRLLQAEVDGEGLTDDEILGFFQFLLVAGHETTTNLIDNAVLSFVENPGELARLRATPDLLPSAIEEVLRHRSPVQATFRLTRRDVELHGQVIPARRLVLAMIGSANRDPAHFPDPDRFDITRHPNAHLAFGHGVHFCLGAALSRLEGRIALADLLERAPGLALASDQPWEPRQAFHVHGPNHLRVRLTAAVTPPGPRASTPSPHRTPPPGR
jgi:cytochrome P450